MFTPKRMKVMVRYKNVDGKSKVAKYNVTKDTMTVRFVDHSEYVYTNQSVGPETMKKMKALALAGKGLGTFIDANVKDRFSRKVR